MSRWFAMDAEGEFHMFDSPEEARACAVGEMEAERDEAIYDGEWSTDCVERVCWGEVKEQCFLVPIPDGPPDARNAKMVEPHPKPQEP